MRLKEVRERLFAAVLTLLVVFGSVACSEGNNGVEPEPTEPDGETVIVATFNVRYNNPNDGANAWPNRTGMVTDLIKNHKFDVFGAQEPYYDQLNDMTELLPDYAYVGRSRTNETNKGEFVPIFYHKDRIEILESDQFWLTHEEDKSVPSIGWDAGSPRICTWAKVRHKVLDEIFYVFNVHYAHDGVGQARMESTRLMMEEVPRIADGYPYFLIGDFNYHQNSAAYQLLRSSEDLIDTYDIAERKINGGRGTLNGFNPNNTSTNRIDHIFVNKENSPTIRRHQIITDATGGRTPSDHFPVMVEVIF